MTQEQNIKTVFESQYKFSVLLYGLSSSGKTHGALEFARGFAEGKKILGIDTEGQLSLTARNLGIQLPIWNVQLNQKLIINGQEKILSPLEQIYFFTKQACLKGYDTVIIDSTSDEYVDYIGESTLYNEENSKKQGKEVWSYVYNYPKSRVHSDWIKSISKMAPVNVICTARAFMETNKEGEQSINVVQDKKQFLFSFTQKLQGLGKQTQYQFTIDRDLSGFFPNQNEQPVFKLTSELGKSVRAKYENMQQEFNPSELLTF